MARNKLVERIRTARILSKRELRFSVFSLAVYLPVFFSFLIAYFLIRNYISSLETNGVMVVSNPLNMPFYICVMVSSIYLALSSAISITREKEQGTLEILFYGPVDTPSYLIGKFLEHLGAYLVMLVFYIIFFVIASLTTNFGFSLAFVKTVILSVFIVSSMVAFGTLISTLTARIKNAVLLFLGLILAFLGLQFLGSILGNIQPDNMSSMAAYARSFISAIVGFVQWISPFSYLFRGIDAVDQGSTVRYLISLVSSVAYSTVLMILSAIIFERRGVKKG